MRKEHLLIIVPVYALALAGWLVVGIKATTPVKVEANSTIQEQMADAARDYTAMYAAQEWLSDRGISVPEDIRSECIQAGTHYRVCPELLMAIAYKESRFQKTAQNGSCVGIMQINLSSNKKRLDPYGTDYYNIHSQAYAAASLISDLATEYAIDGEEADAGTILAAYHGENFPLERTPSEYTETILEISANLERAHGK